MKNRDDLIKALLKSSIIVMSISIIIICINNLSAKILIDNEKATKKVQAILTKKENDDMINNIITQIENATKNIKSKEELMQLVKNENIVTITKNEANFPTEVTRSNYKVNGVNTGNNIYISSIDFISYENIDENELYVDDKVDTISICKPIYKITQGGPLPDKISLTKGGWFLDVHIPIKDNSKIIGEILVRLDITDMPKIPQNVKRDEVNDPFMIAKPVIYLYPEEKQNIKVRLDYDGELHTTYPKYNNEMKGWDVIAYPDSTVINKEDNLEYSYIFWDGYSEKLNPSFEEGYVVKGEDTQKFLQDILPKMGMTPKEYNEFIVYWLPLMEKNEYNIISFLEDEYTNLAKLDITPKPDSLLRVFMVYKGVDEKEANKIKHSIKEPTIKPFKRNGFTVIEWGGSSIS